MNRLFQRQGLAHGNLVGCEATSQHLTIVHLKPGKRPRVNGLHRVPNPGLDPRALRAMAQELGLEHATWTWVLPPDQYQLMLVDVPEVPAEEVKAALHWRMKDLITFPLDEAAIDTMLLPPEAFRGRSRMAFAAVARQEHTQPVTDAFGLAGLKLAAIDVADTALRVLATMSAQSNAVALLKVGPNESTLNATFNGALCLHRAISLGSRDLNAGHDPDEDALSLQDQTEMQLDALGLELQRSFDYFDTQLGLGAINELRILSEEPLDPSVYEFLANRFDCRSGPLNVADFVDLPDSVEPRTIYRHAAALGAAAQWLDRGGI